MIAIQVAMGIVLAYVIIINQRKLLALGGWMLRAAGFLVAIGGLIWAGVAAAQFAGAWIPPRLWHKLWTMIGLIPIFILAATATVGMILFTSLFARQPAMMPGKLFKSDQSDPKKQSNDGCLLAMGLAFGMLMINYAISFPIWAYTPVGSWYDAIDLYGRANGWDDGLSILFCAVLWQWVWIPVGVAYIFSTKRRAKFAKGSKDIEGIS